MRPFDLTQSQSLPSGIGVEFDDPHQRLTLAAHARVQEAGEFRKYLGEHHGRTSPVCVREGRARQFAGSQMVMMLGIGVPLRLQAAQAVRRAELGEDRHHQVGEAIERLDVSVAAVPPHGGFHRPAIERSQKLAEDARLELHVPSEF